MRYWRRGSSTAVHSERVAMCTTAPRVAQPQAQERIASCQGHQVGPASGSHCVYARLVSEQHMIAAATAVFDPGSCQVGWQAASGTYRGYPVELEYRVGRSASTGAGRAMLIVIVHGPTGGVRFHVSAVAVFADPQYQITGDPAFDSRYDVRGAPMVVLRWLFSDPALRARMLAVPTTFFDLEPERLKSSAPTDLDADALRRHLDIACAVFQQLPVAIHQSGALAATGGRSLAFHPEVQQHAQRRTTVRFLVFGLVGLIVGVPILGALLLLLLAVAC